MKRIDFDGATDEMPDMPDGSPEPVCGACQKRNGCIVQFDTFTGRANVCRDCLKTALDMVGGDMVGSSTPFLRDPLQNVTVELISAVTHLPKLDADWTRSVGNQFSDIMQSARGLQRACCGDEYHSAESKFLQTVRDARLLESEITTTSAIWPPGLEAFVRAAITYGRVARNADLAPGELPEYGLTPPPGSAESVVSRALRQLITALGPSGSLTTVRSTALLLADNERADTAVRLLARALGFYAQQQEQRHATHREPTVVSRNVHGTATEQVFIPGRDADADADVLWEHLQYVSACYFEMRKLYRDEQRRCHAVAEKHAVGPGAATARDIAAEILTGEKP